MVSLHVGSTILGADDPFTEWKSIPVVASSHIITTRMLNRTVVGLPLCASLKILLLYNALTTFQVVTLIGST